MLDETMHASQKIAIALIRETICNMLTEANFADYHKLSNRARFNLKKTSSLLINPVIKIILDIAAKNEGKIDKTLKIVGFYDGEDYDIHYKNKGKKGKEIISCDELSNDEFMTKINYIGGIDIDIHVNSNLKLELDADYAYDPTDNDDLGGIVITITLPIGFLDVESLTGEINRKIIGMTSHEFQHVSQRLIHNIKFDHSADKSFIKHMNDIDEIDARIEEIIAMLHDDFDFQNIATFKDMLIPYIEHYLDRNGVICKTKKHVDYRQKMIDNHLQKYKEKFNL